MKRTSNRLVALALAAYLIIAAIACYAIIHANIHGQLSADLAQVAKSKCNNLSQAKTLLRCHEF